MNYKNQKIKWFIELSKKEFKNFYKEKGNSITTEFINCLIDKGGDGTEIGKIAIGTNKKNFLSDDNFLKNQVIPSLAKDLKEKEVVCIAWKKLIKKNFPAEDGTANFKKGIVMVFESIEGTEIVCEEIIEKPAEINETGKIKQSSIEFGEQILLEETSKIKNKFKTLLSFKGYCEELFCPFKTDLSNFNFN